MRLTMLPKAFTTVSATVVWIDPINRLVVVDASSAGKADAALTALVKSIEGMALQLVQTQQSPAAAMSVWLATKEAPAKFSVDRECELKAADESKAVVKYGRHALDTDEVSQHIAMGKVPTKLALTWNDQVSFVLTDGMQLKKLTLLDVVFEASGKKSDGDSFDADIAIFTGVFTNLLPDLMDALGGEIEGSPSGTPDPAGESGDSDALYDQAVEAVRKHGKPSISLVQREFNIGYNRAARLVEAMEKNGVVGPSDSAGQRKVLDALSA